MNSMIKQRLNKATDVFKKVIQISSAKLNEVPDFTDSTVPVHVGDNTRYIPPHVAWIFRWIWGLIVLIWYAIFQLTSILYLIITWFIVALALERFIQFWQQLGCSRWFALWLSYLILVLFMLSGMIIMVPFVITQLISLLQLAFGVVQDLQTQIQAEWLVAVIQGSFLPEMMKTWFIGQAGDGWWMSLVQSVVSENISQIVSVGGESLKSAWSLAVNLVDGVLSALAKVILVMTIAVFFSLERTSVFTFISKLTKKPARTYATLQQLSMKLWVWLEGQLLLCIIIWLCVACGLWVISWFGFDLPNKFSLSLIAWLTEFLPYIWPLLGSIPALLVALIAFWWKWFLITVLLYRGIQTAENNVIVPAVMSQKVGVSPLVIFLCMLLGASLFGFLWVLLSVPLAIIVSIFIQIRFDTKE